MKYRVVRELEIRTQAGIKKGEKRGLLLPGFILDVVSEVSGDLYEGNSQWLQDANGFFYWKGGVEALQISNPSPYLPKISYPGIVNLPPQVIGSKGKGVVIAIFDTGCISHPDLEGRIIEFYDAVEERVRAEKEYIDDSGHGTFVAGLIASSGKTSGIVGLAPEADLVVVKISKERSISSANLYRGLKWLLKERTKKPIHFINMSFSCALPPSTKDGIETLIKEAWEAGIVMFGAAGDEKQLFGTASYLNFPAKNSHVVSVGAVHKKTPANSLLNPAVKFVVAAEKYHSLEADKSGKEVRQGSSYATALTTATAALFRASDMQGTASNELLIKTMAKQLPSFQQLSSVSNLTMYKHE
jgi:subtilisin family serine protease